MIERISSKIVLTVAILFLLLFLPIYSLFLKNYFILYFLNSNNHIDQKYYLDIFNHLEFSILFTILLLIIIKLSANRILTLIKNLSLQRLLYYLIIFQSITQFVNTFLIETIQHSDSAFYLSHGIRLAETGSYLSAQGNFTAFWPVGIPFIISLFHNLGLPEILSFQMMNILLSSVLLILFKFSLKNILNENELKLFLILFTLFPNNLLISQSILTELPYLFLVWMSFFLVFYQSNKFVKTRFFLVGIITGINILVRANAIMMIPIIILTLIKFDKKYFSKILLFVLGSIIIVSPWALRNYQHFGKAVISSTNGGFNFLMGNHINSSGKINFDFEYDITNKNEVEESDKAYKQGIDDMIENPVKTLIRLPKKIFWSYWRGDFSLTWALKETKNEISPIIKSFLFFSNNLYFYLIITVSLLGFIKIPKGFISNKQIFFLNLYFIVNLLMILIYVGSERYIYSVFPLHILYFIKNFKIEKN